MSYPWYGANTTVPLMNCELKLWRLHVRLFLAEMGVGDVERRAISDRAARVRGTYFKHLALVRCAGTVDDRKRLAAA